ATILYQLYTARNPFAGKHLGEVDRAITDSVPHPLNMAHQRVPPAISGVILRALSKNPRDRYQNAKDLIEALESAAKTEPVRAPAAAPAKPAPAKATVADSTGKVKPLPVSRPTAAPATVKMPAMPAPPRVQVRASNNWKMIGVIVAGLVVVAGLAALFQRKPSEVITETPTPKPTLARVQPTPEQVSEPEPTPDESATELDT